MAQTEQIQGVIEHITFRGDDGVFGIAVVMPDDESGDLQTVVGPLGPVEVGETVRIEGYLEDNPRYGRQFRIEQCVPILPATIRGIERFLSSGLIEGVGPALAERIVDAFGEDTLEIIETSPDRLLEVSGIGEKKAEQITSSLAEKRNVREIMIFLQAHGLGTSLSLRILRTYGDKAAAILRSKPYRLCKDVWGIGFKTADRVARDLGVEADSPQRAKAGIEYVLDRATSEGHTCIEREALIARTSNQLSADREVVESALADLKEEGEVREAVFEDDHWIYLRRLHYAETDVAARLADLSATEPGYPEIDAEEALRWVQFRAGIDLSDEQLGAIRLALSSKLLVLTGGPGVGKTTVIKSILDILETKSVEIALCAPTGRAAKRIAETTGREAKTIHRLLKFDPRAGGFQHDEEDPVPADLIIVDEVSMVDITLMSALVRAVPHYASLILVGDPDQLPSVGPGNVLGDLITSKRVPTAALTQIFRQKKTSLIIRNAHRINRGLMPRLDAETATADFYFSERQDPVAARDLICRLVEERIPAKFELDPIDDVQVLAPMHRGECGVQKLNETLRALLNPPQMGEKENAPFRSGDKVMQLRNDYEREVFNGDLGRVVGVSGGTLTVRFEDKVTTYDPTEREALTLAYASTIHKAQGCEYPAVIIPLLSQHYVMLQRNLLYTAITRARELVVIVGTRKAMGIAVRNDKMARRQSFLDKRLQEATG